MGAETCDAVGDKDAADAIWKKLSAAMAKKDVNVVSEFQQQSKKSEKIRKEVFKQKEIKKYENWGYDWSSLEAGSSAGEGPSGTAAARFFEQEYARGLRRRLAQEFQKVYNQAEFHPAIDPAKSEILYNKAQKNMQQITADIASYVNSADIQGPPLKAEHFKELKYLLLRRAIINLELQRAHNDWMFDELAATFGTENTFTEEFLRPEDMVPDFSEIWNDQGYPLNHWFEEVGSDGEPIGVPNDSPAGSPDDSSNGSSDDWL
ncbi:hypothetical protein IWX49DRAFT_601784 [Phyllosticta citricarpa]|uniref:Uncharacterized protein n=1 Tax=Phyllosticta citricarpa TaxID=55181 RepID=A0ABR1LX23_9PEZI